MPGKVANYERKTKPGRNSSEIARLLGASEELVSRIPKAPGNRLAEVVSLLNRALPESIVRDYLNHPNPNLSGERPIGLLLRGESGRVEGDLLALMEGVYR
jgi:uncharacterized protein (DUF2384 family)